MPWQGYCAWLAIHLTAFVLVIVVVLRDRDRNPQPIRSGIAVVGACVNTLTVALFTYVFQYGQSSNVAQQASGGDMSYWGLWFDCFMPLVFAYLILAPTTILIFLTKPGSAWTLSSRMMNVMATLFSAYQLIRHAPDA